MTLNQLAAEIGAKVILPAKDAGASAKAVYAGDRISDLLNNAGGQTLVVTHLSGGQLIRFAELMDVPGICLLNGIIPDSELIASAGEHGTLVMVSPHGMYETCGRIYQALSRSR